MKDYEKHLKSGLGDILRKVSSAYADRASKFVPPRVDNQWKKTIPAKLYKRNVYPLSALVKKKDNINGKQYVAKLREGYRFCVIGRVRGRVHRWYAKSLRQTAQYRRIFNRGLFKYMFGASLSSINAETPQIFKTLVSKSPNLGKLKHLNRVALSIGQTTKADVGNMAWDNDKFARESKYQGQRAGKKVLKKEFQEFNKKVYRV